MAAAAPVLFVPAPQADVAGIGTFLPAGSAAERMPGTAHLLEHVLFDQHFRHGWPERQGGRIRALTARFWTAYLWSGPAAEAHAALRQMQGLFDIARLQPALVEHHRRILRLELEQRHAEQKLLEPGIRLNAEAFAGTGFDTSPLGTPEGIAAVTPEALEAFRQQCYRPRDAAVIVAAPRQVIEAMGRQGVVIDPDNPAMPPAMAPCGGSHPSRAGQPRFRQIVAESGENRHLLFACLGTAALPLAPALAASRLFAHWLMRNTPGSLVARLQPHAVAPADITLSCELTPAGQPVLSGSIALRERDADAVMPSVEATLRDLARIEIDTPLLDQLKLRQANTQPPLWSAEGLLQLGAGIATYGAAAALDAEGQRSRLSVAEMRRFFHAFQRLD